MQPRESDPCGFARGVDAKAKENSDEPAIIIYLHRLDLQVVNLVVMGDYVYYYLASARSGRPVLLPTSL